MLATGVVVAYLALVLYLGIFAFRRSANTGEGYFVADRKFGPWLFGASLFGTNMTAVAILGSSGLAYSRGVGVYGLMASSSGIVIPLTLLFVGKRLWAWGKRFGHITQVQMLRDRWECGGIGTVFALVTGVMLIPLIVVGMIGGGTTLATLSGNSVPFPVGAALVGSVVVAYVFLGGMRGTAWVNALQTTLFLVFGAVAVVLIGNSLGGFDHEMARLAANPATASLLDRSRIPAEEFASYLLIPLSAITFPHMSIMCMTAREGGHFRRVAVVYPLCIMLVWLPAVYLGLVAAAEYPGLKGAGSNDVLLRLLIDHTGPLVSGLLGASIMACVMASDSQILALSTIFTEDVYTHYAGKERATPARQVRAGRLFVVVIGLVAFAAAWAWRDHANLFELAVRYTFSGYAALFPVLAAALFWRRSTKWGALAATVWVALAMAANAWITARSNSIAPPAGKQPVPVFPELGDLFLRGSTVVTVYGYLPVVPMLAISTILLVLVSWITPPPGRETIERYFPANPT